MYPSLLIGLAVVVAAPAPKEAPKKEATIVGEWIGEKAVSGGKEMPVPPGGISFGFHADGTLTIKEGGRTDGKTGSYKVDPKKNPAEIDLIPPADKKDDTILGIYKLEGDTLTLCFQKGDPERPTKFESPEGERTVVITMKRVKKD
jgi:uncharacterized protein (TIGR03067 family)